MREDVRGRRTLGEEALLLWVPLTIGIIAFIGCSSALSASGSTQGRAMGIAALVQLGVIVVSYGYLRLPLPLPFLSPPIPTESSQEVGRAAPPSALSAEMAAIPNVVLERGRGEVTIRVRMSGLPGNAQDQLLRRLETQIAAGVAELLAEAQARESARQRPAR